DRVRIWRQGHEKQIVGELANLLAIPNVAAADPAAIQRNADRLQEMLRRRGFTTQILRAGEESRPAVYGELRAPGATRTVVFYAHYAGHPVEPQGRAARPWRPTRRT